MCTDIHPCPKANSSGKFAFVPVEVLLDKRLRFETMRVLIALYSFSDKKHDTVWPTRESIAKRSRTAPNKVSESTKELVDLGWLTKDGKGGHSKATRYTIIAPLTATESGTISESTTVPEEGRRMPVPEQGTRKLTNQDLTKKKQRQPKPETTLVEFLDSCKETGRHPIDAVDPIFSWAENAGISCEMVKVCWRVFKQRRSEPDAKGKLPRQRDWPAQFRNCVKSNWFKLWYIKSGELANWTTNGEAEARQS